LIQDVHFTLNIYPWDKLGWKALAVNLSDIAAMGGTPRYALVSLAFPGDIKVDDVKLLYKGMLELATKYGVAIVGGNVSSSPVAVIDITVIGDAAETNGNILLRSSAKIGEQIAVTGFPGTAAAGLDMLKRGIQFNTEADLSVRDAFLHPEPRLVEGKLLVEHGVKTAIDISDGLLSDLRHICKASRVCARLDIDKIPYLPAVKTVFGEKSIELALSGGEDYELLFTASQAIMDKVINKAECTVTVIGEIVDGEAGEVIMVDSSGNHHDSHKMGWDHFKR
jgi:thiamine-monophosphate kinase